ncbi:ogr/Delta-like zinc finger family protein [Pantoea septica]|uniref:ogr/Delta-like zinc finger family protein n=1 Tax=Pantoea septica TaxID=472695 RepID=UPI0028984117|nr:ogr/Delta-like zinc finger family protein [Pantoea septica]
MMHCPLCQSAAHTRSSRYISNETKERYNQCQNINCSCTFKTHKSVTGMIVTPGKVEKVAIAKKQPEVRA